jgi:phage shock protein A
MSIDCELTPDHSGQADNVQLTAAVAELQAAVGQREQAIEYLRGCVAKLDNEVAELRVLLETLKSGRSNA